MIWGYLHLWKPPSCFHTVFSTTFTIKNWALCQCFSSSWNHLAEILRSSVGQRLLGELRKIHGWIWLNIYAPRSKDLDFHIHPNPASWLVDRFSTHRHSKKLPESEALRKSQCNTQEYQRISDITNLGGATSIPDISVFLVPGLSVDFVCILGERIPDRSKHTVTSAKERQQIGGRSQASWCAGRKHTLRVATPGHEDRVFPPNERL